MTTEPAAYLVGVIAGGQAACRAALALPVTPGKTINAVWADFAERIRRTESPDGKIAVAEQARAVMRGFTALALPHRVALAQAEATFTYPADANAARAEAEEAWAAQPDLRQYRAEQLEALAARDAAMAAAIEAQQAQAERDAPMAVLTVLRSRGLHFGLSDDGKSITLPPAEAATLTAGDMEALKLRRAGIIEILKAEGEASRPVTVV